MELKGNEKDLIKWGVIVGVLVLLLMFFNRILKSISVFFGVEKSDEQKALEAENTATIVNEVNTQVLKQPSTKSDAEWLIIADLVYNDLALSSVQDSTDDATYNVARCKNDTDLWKLYEKFGKRQAYAFMVPVGSPKDLLAFVRDDLSTKQIAVINDNYKRKNMKFRF